MSPRRFHCADLMGLAVDRLAPGARPELLAIFCHGYGAPADDLFPLAEELFDQQPELAATTRFLFPAAPLSLDSLGMYGGRAWWPIDLEGLAESIERGELRNPRGYAPPELAEAGRKLSRLAIEQADEAGLPLSRVVLGGFSQGSMAATEAALRLPATIGGLCIYSGTLLFESEWRELAEGKRGLQVFQSHGRFDPLLPFAAAEWLRDLFVAAGARVDFLAFDGSHTIPPAALARTADLLKAAAQ